VLFAHCSAVTETRLFPGYVLTCQQVIIISGQYSWCSNVLLITEPTKQNPVLSYRKTCVLT